MSSITSSLLLWLVRYGVPTYVTENGLAWKEDSAAIALNDTMRQSYIRSHVEAVGQALVLGADVRGYFVWSFQVSIFFLFLASPLHKVLSSSLSSFTPSFLNYYQSINLSYFSDPPPPCRTTLSGTLVSKCSSVSSLLSVRHSSAS